MPNWCDTTYKIVGEKKDLKRIHKALQTLENRKTPLVQNGFGNLWLGCVINYFGGDWENCDHCRGEISTYELDEENSMLTLFCQTAWSESSGFREFMQTTFPDTSWYFREEEPGCEVYYTNSFDYFPEHYFLDNYDEPLYFETLDELCKCVQSITGTDVKTEDDCEKALDEYLEEHEDEDVFYSLHVFKESD